MEQTTSRTGNLYFETRGGAATARRKDSPHRLLSMSATSAPSMKSACAPTRLPNDIKPDEMLK